MQKTCLKTQWAQITCISHGCFTSAVLHEAEQKQTRVKNKFPFYFVSRILNVWRLEPCVICHVRDVAIKT